MNMYSCEPDADARACAAAEQRRGPDSPRTCPRQGGGAWVVVGLGLALCSLPSGVEAQFDDFNDGDDQGWTHVSPLAPFGVPGVFTVTNGGYRIQTTRPSPNPASLGPPRAYS